MVLPFKKEENIEFSDEAEYNENQGLSLNEILLRHLRKISDLCCQEFTGGYWDKIPIRTESGIMFAEKYHQDIREAFCNAIDFLIDVLYPLSDDEFRKFIDENEDVDNEEQDIKKKLVRKRKTFKEMNKMFNRINFWNTAMTTSEGQR